MAFTNSLEDMLKIYNWGDSEVVQYTGLGNRAAGRISQDYNQLLTSGGTFVDPAFPHENKSVGELNEIFDDAQGHKTLQGIVDKGFNPRVGYTWVRIKDYVHLGTNKDGYSTAETRTPVFSCGSVRDALARTDIGQGLVGNCWFLAALGAISTNKEQFEHCVPTDNVYNEAGVYHFVFWYQGLYVDVVVDDYIPVFPQEQQGFKYHRTVGARPADHGDVLEWWGPLAEKAFSKLHGSYLETVGGQVSNGFENITGGFPEQFPLGRETPHDALDIIKKHLGTNVFVGVDCTTDAYGVHGGHAYSITGHTTVNYEGEKIDLIRVYNPWGHGEWEADWCDSDPRWDALTDNEKKNRVVNDDGEFWMRFEHLRQIFANLHVVASYTVEDFQRAAGKLAIERHFGSWSIANNTAGGAGARQHDNPRYEINVRGSGNECALGVTLSPERTLHSKYQHTFLVYKDRVDGRTIQMDVYGQQPSLTPHFATYGFKVSPGKYIISPMTYEAGDERKFCLRILYQTS